MTPPSVAVRRLTASDTDLVLAASGLFLSAPSVEWTEDFLSRGGNLLLMAFVDDAPAGTLIGVETGTPGASPDLLIYQVFVAPEHRAHGVARAMVRKAVDVATEAGCSRVWASLVQGPEVPSVESDHQAETLRQQAVTIVIPTD